MVLLSTPWLVTGVGLPAYFGSVLIISMEYQKHYYGYRTLVGHLLIDFTVTHFSETTYTI